MSKTRSEQLQDKVGKRVECDYCRKDKTFNHNWRMTSGHLLACPDCAEKIKADNKVLVNI